MSTRCTPHKFFGPWAVLFFFIGCLIASCEKVIDVPVNDIEKKYVIEGILTDRDNSCRVNLSRTLNYHDPNNFEGVNGAHVSIAEAGNDTVQLTPSGDGVYRADVSGTPGHTYTLRVEVDGKVFTATSTMPAHVKLDTIYVTERLFLGKIRKIATAVFTDPPGTGNAYRFIQYVDDQKENTIFVNNDNLIDGRKVINELLIFGDEDYTLKSRDNVRIEMHSISQPMYKYWYSLSQSALGESQTASPGNPISIFGNGALGYFSAHCFEVKEMVVP